MPSSNLIIQAVSHPIILPSCTFKTLKLLFPLKRARPAVIAERITVPEVIAKPKVKLSMELTWRGAWIVGRIRRLAGSLDRRPHSAAGREPRSPAAFSGYLGASIAGHIRRLAGCLYRRPHSAAVSEPRWPAVNFGCARASMDRLKLRLSAGLHRWPHPPDIDSGSSVSITYRQRRSLLRPSIS
jgi:hypothetical protein